MSHDGIDYASEQVSIHVRLSAPVPGGQDDYRPKALSRPTDTRKSISGVTGFCPHSARHALPSTPAFVVRLLPVTLLHSKVSLGARYVLQERCRVPWPLFPTHRPAPPVSPSCSFLYRHRIALSVSSVHAYFRFRSCSHNVTRLPQAICCLRLPDGISHTSDMTTESIARLRVVRPVILSRITWCSVDSRYGK